MQMQEIMQFVSAHPILSVAWIVLFVAVLVTTFKSRFSKVKGYEQENNAASL